jgi:cytochrome b pre-mRNA-processing protein 3
VPWWQRLRAHLQERRQRRDVVHRLYTKLVAQAREPCLFTDLAVPDTREGRLEALSLHAILLLRRLHDEGTEGQAVAQELFDLMFADIDQHMREWGVGDLSVGKHVKRVAQTFYARAAALTPGLSAGDGELLVGPLAHNVYGDAGATEAAQRLAAYLLRQEAWIRTLPGTTLLAGELTFDPAACRAD